MAVRRRNNRGLTGLAGLFARLEATDAPGRKEELLTGYLKGQSREELPYALALLSDRRPKRVLSLKDLAGLGAAVAGLPDWLYAESLRRTGDLSEAVALLVPPASSPQVLSLADVFSALSEWKQLPEEVARERIAASWNRLGTNERFLLNKLLTGSFRSGVPILSLSAALSRLFSLPPAYYTYQIQSEWASIYDDIDQWLTRGHSLVKELLPRPFPAHREVEGLSDLDGDPGQWSAIRALEGIRCQWVVSEGKMQFWSEEGHWWTESFPEFQPCAVQLGTSAVIDGLIRPAADHVTMDDVWKRIRRKKATSAHTAATPVRFEARDLLEQGATDLAGTSAAERQKRLRNLIASLKADLVYTPSKIDFDDAATLKAVWHSSRKERSTGLLLAGTGNAWHWWKARPFGVRAVLLYAEKGQGRMADLFSRYTFAVWSGDQLIPIGKTGLGLDEEAIREIDRFVKTNTLERFGPVRSVRPVLVGDLVFDAIRPAPRRKSGIVLEGLRMNGDLRELDPNSIDSLETLAALL